MTLNRQIELEQKISILEEQIESLESDLESFEVDPEDYEDQFCEHLDDINTINIGSLSYSASYVLRKIDPIAYREGLNDYIDGIIVSEDQNYQDIENEIEDLKNDLEDLQSELEDLQAELEEEEEEEEL